MKAPSLVVPPPDTPTALLHLLVPLPLCRPKESFISQTINAFDFAEVRSKRDRELLYEAKYGERGPDGKMTREQYQ